MSGCSNNIRLFNFLAAILIVLSGISSYANEESGPSGERFIVLEWQQLEPDLMNYKFDDLLRKPLEEAFAEDQYVVVMILVGADCPIWLYYSRDVPRVYTDRKRDDAGKRVSRLDNRFPYYLDAVYKEAFYDLVNAFGTYVENIPEKLRERILYIQSCEGAGTGSTPYKGNPEKEDYAISEADWEEYRLQTWKLYRTNFPDIPILINTGTSLLGWAE